MDGNASVGFQSTPPYGGDPEPPAAGPCRAYFNPRPHTGATRSHCAASYLLLISIHAPIRGRRASTATAMRPLRFQSTPPYGGDNSSCICPGISAYFNPRPHTGATFIILTGSKTFLFQSTPPYGGDVRSTRVISIPDISIHAPIRGRPRFPPARTGHRDFNPRPHTGATDCPEKADDHALISIHAPIRGRPGFL